MTRSRGRNAIRIGRVSTVWASTFVSVFEAHGDRSLVKAVRLGQPEGERSTDGRGLPTLILEVEHGGGVDAVSLGADERPAAELVSWRRG